MLREVIAASLSLTVGSILFGIVFAKFAASGEGVALVAALVLSIPVSSMLLQAVRSGHLRLPELSIPKGVPPSEWKVKGSERFADFWKSLDAEEKEGLHWLTGMIAANVLAEPPASGKPFVSLDQVDIVDLEEKLITSGQEELIVKVKGKGKKNSFVVVRVDRQKRQVYYSLRPKEAL